MSFELLSQIVDQYEDLKYDLLKSQLFSEEHFGFPPICYKIMETDTARVNAFKKAFEQYDFSDKVVCEAGVGTLALTRHFLPQVKKAYLIENNPHIRDFINSKLVEAGWQDKVELIFGNAMEIELPEQVDYVIGELMSIYCAYEYQVSIFKNLRKYLKPGGKLLPEKVINIAQLSNAVFDEDYIHYPINFTRHLPEVLSLQSIVNTTNLYDDKELEVDSTIKIKAILSGTTNSIYMRSFVQVAEGCNFSGTDSLMPPTVWKLQQSKQLIRGKEVALKVQFHYGKNLEFGSCRILD